MPFDVIPVGDDLLLQSRYGKLVFVQYLQFEPGGRRARFFTGIHAAAWAKAAEDLGNWERLKSWLGLGGFQIHPNRAMAAGFRGTRLPRAGVYFTGGGSAVQRLVAQHGAALFDADRWQSEARGEDESKSNKPEKYVVTFERTSLPVPESERDASRIRAILSLLKGESTAISQGGEDTQDTSSTSTQLSGSSDGGLTLVQWAESFADPERGWGLNLTNSQTVRCHAAQARQASADPSADLLLSVAASKTIAVYVHGLNVFADGAQPSLDELEQDWREHVAVLKAGSPSWGYCLVAWNTEQGVSDEQTQLPYLLFALRTLADHAELFDPARRVTVVAHSAGGLYAEHAWLKLQSTEVAQSKFNPLRGAPDTPTQLVTLGTPHQGAAFAESARKMSEYFPLVMKMSNVKLNDQAMALLQQHMLEKANYRGVVQMRAVADNPWLAELNANFAQATPPDRLVALGGSADPLVSAAEAHSAVGSNHVLDGYDHQMLLAPKGGFAQFMSGLYLGSL